MREYTQVLRLHAKFHPDRFVASLLRGENPKFYCIFNFNILWWQHVAAQRQTWTRKHIHKPSLSNGNKIISILKRLHGEVPFKSVTDRKKNKKNMPSFDPRRGTKPHHTLQSDRGGPYCFCMFKTLTYPTCSSADRGRWKFGGNAPLTLNPIAPEYGGIPQANPQI